MKTYRMTVQIVEPYEPTKREREQMHYPYGPGSQIVPTETTRDVLTVALNETQWRAVRDAAVGGWE
jgi:hypothetical protein